MAKKRKGFFGFLSRLLGQEPKPPVAMKADASEALIQHSKQFERGIVKVCEGVHVAIGYGLANVVLLEGDDGIVLIDTLESADAAKILKAELEQVTQKPLKAIILTHNHTDHIFGAGVFAEGQKPDIYAHETTSALIDNISSVLRPVISTRSMRQFGVFLPEEDQINAGIGKRLEIGPEHELALMRPTHTVKDRLAVTIAGMSLELIHAPGETNDHIVVWMPEKKVMVCADNFYHAFPNLYAIRGTSHRDVMKWVKSLDLIRSYPIEYLVPCHTRPIVGKEKVFQTLTDYRDGIQYVHDQTVRWMNHKHTPDQIVSKVQLPEHLANAPFLQEFYGTVAWSVRSIFNGYLGWFSGNPTHLDAYSDVEKARRYEKLAGGMESLKANTKQAFEQEDMQWVLEMTDHILALEPEDETFKEMRRKALIFLGEKQTSANGRNYYLTSALELGGFEIPILRNANPELVQSIAMDFFFRSLSVNLAAERCLELDQCVGFRFPDSQEAYTVHIRKGVAEIQSHFPEKPDVSITMDSYIWKEMLAGLRKPGPAFAKGQIKVDGGIGKLLQFFRCFDREFQQ